MLLGLGNWWLNRSGLNPLQIGNGADGTLPSPTSGSDATTADIEPGTPPPTTGASTPNGECGLVAGQPCATLAQVPAVPAGSFNYGGSTVFASLRQSFVTDALAVAHPTFELRYTEPISGKPGSGEGIKMLLDGQLSFAQSSRPLSDEEYALAQGRGFQLRQIPIATDALVFFVNPELVLATQGLTLAQVQDIYSGKIKNWTELGGPDLAITPFIRTVEGGGTFFQDAVLADGDLGDNVQELRDTTTTIQRVASTSGAIAYATAAQALGQQTIKAMPLQGSNGEWTLPAVAGRRDSVNYEGLEDGSYPLTRRLFVIVRKDGLVDEQAGVAYANLLLSQEGQALVEQAGFMRLY
jgi:phosphate transport system substrate-binding protein